MEPENQRQPKHRNDLQLVEAAAYRNCSHIHCQQTTAGAVANSGGCLVKFALVNPAWTFERSTYFGCQEPHYPLELLFAADQIKEAGHQPLLIDARLQQLGTA